MLTLAIETSGPVGSVAVFDSGKVLGEQTLELGRQHGQVLIPAIGRLLSDCGKSARDCNLVAVSVGPGSFTGLRVGVVCAKTLAYAAGCQLAAVNTLHAIACNSPANVSVVHVICDAQRGDVFVGKYIRNAGGDWLPEGHTSILSAASWITSLTPDDVISGPALEKLAEPLGGRCRMLAADCRIPHSVWIGRLGIRQIEAGLTSDLWSVEPLYLRRSSAELQWEKLHPGK